jgi:hypothetical protein
MRIDLNPESRQACERGFGLHFGQPHFKWSKPPDSNRATAIGRVPRVREADICADQQLFDVIRIVPRELIRACIMALGHSDSHTWTKKTLRLHIDEQAV